MSTPHQSSQEPTGPTINLTPTESRFLSLLNEFAQRGRKTFHIPERGHALAQGNERDVVGSGVSAEEDSELIKMVNEVREIEHVECRIAGGWVRDKLLNLPSSDLDVTLSTIAGYPFARAFVAWLHMLFPANPPALDASVSMNSTICPPETIIPADPSDAAIAGSLSSIGKVAANPDQSKHLETATTRIMGLELDFVALRSESYADGSRIPSEVRLGTPEEDALRRDITINTLFYNVHTEQIEDHTHFGLSDLREGIIRTPLPPIQTFRDDPLRILRCVRFASRFRFGLVENLEDALANVEILEALRTRISRERVGIEVEKMLKGPDPLLSIQMMTPTAVPRAGSNLYPHVFIIPPTTSVPDANPCPAPHPVIEARLSAEILDNLLPDGNWNKHVHPALFSRGRQSQKSLEKSKAKEMWLACCLAPYRDGTVKEKKKDVTMAEAVIKDGLKLSNSDATAVNHFFAAASALSCPSIDFSKSTIRSTIGNMLRQPFIHNAITETLWTDSLLFSLVLDLLPHSCKRGTATAVVLVPEEIEILQRYHTFIDKMESLGIPSIMDDKPILDGKEINALLGIKPSQFTGVVLARVVTWQLDHPQKGKEECKEWLTMEKEEGRMEAPVADTASRATKKQKKG